MIAIVKYNAGNIRSVSNALNRLGAENKVTDCWDEIQNADKVIFPGVGEAGAAMSYLREKELDQLIPTLTQPVLGICLGLQLLCQSTEESETKGLNVFNTSVKRFPDKEKVPHIGWNNFRSISSELFQGIKTDDDVYYVHSYYAELCPQTIAQCDYILPFSAGLKKDNFYSTQFHPEKSADIGEKILQNFLKL